MNGIIRVTAIVLFTMIWALFVSLISNPFGAILGFASIVVWPRCVIFIDEKLVNELMKRKVE